MDQVSGDGCSSTCLVEVGYQCVGMPSVCNGVCGDGVIVGGETCDDHNTLACGTCNSSCSGVIPPRAANGTIQSALGSTQLDAETFTLDDGFNPPITFEWDRNGSISPPRVPVTYQTAFGQGQMADAVTSAVNSVGGTLLIAADHSAGGPTATLTHDRQTLLGNQAITDTVSNAQFVVMGMSGGAAGDCSSGIGCTTNGDCASGTCLVATNTCQ